MTLSRAEALEDLELPIGADPDSIRTSYKRLAQKWHPDKHDRSAQSRERFRKVSLAFKRLLNDNEYVTMSEFEMFEIYSRVVQQHRIVAHCSNGSHSSDYDDSDSSSEDEGPDIVTLLGPKYNKTQQKQFNNNNITSRTSKLTSEEIDRNAKELITEEEREKRKAEKRRAKKKRQREKKRLGKEDKSAESKSIKENGVTDNTNNKSDKKYAESSGSEAEDFDRTAAFFTQVKSKKNRSNTSNNPELYNPLSINRPNSKFVETVKSNGLPDEKADDLILRSRQLAIEGNKNASMEQYPEAISRFTEAIKLDPRDFRFFGNRSYCFDRIQQYERALKDADKAISLAPEWPKGYFRKGRALAGLKYFAEAEQSFIQVLKLDKSCEDAMTELIRVRTQQLTEMGFTVQQAEQAIRQYGTVQSALDSLLAGVVGEASLANEIYESDDEDYSNLNSIITNNIQQHNQQHINNPSFLQYSSSLSSHAQHKMLQQQQLAAASRVGGAAAVNHTPLYSSVSSSPAAAAATTNKTPLSPGNSKHIGNYSNGAVTNSNSNTSHIPPMQPIVRIHRAGDTKMDPHNPDGHTALWVGNVLPEVTQTKLLQLFQKFGTVTSIRMLPEKYCAFVNFKNKEAAGRAMSGLQDQDCGGQKLLIKFPDNALNTGSTSLRKPSDQPPPRQTASQVLKAAKSLNPGSTLLIKKNPISSNNNNNNTQKTQNLQLLHQQEQEDDDDRNSGPVNGDECYFWRTTGCSFGKNCHYRHIAEHRGVDKKPWQKVK